MNTQIIIKHMKSTTTLLQANKQSKHFHLCPRPTHNFCPRRLWFHNIYGGGGSDQHLLHLKRLDRPIFLRVVQNGPIRTELAHPGAGGDTLLQPRALVQVSLIDQFECVDVRLEVFREEIVIVVTDGVQQSVTAI